MATQSLDATLSSPSRRKPSGIGRLTLFPILFSAVAGTASLTQMSAGYRADPELGMIIRSMGAIKLFAVLPFVLAVTWLRTAPNAHTLTRLGYAALALSACIGITLILKLSHVALGAVLFHIGFLGMIAWAACDDGFVDCVKHAWKNKTRD